MAVFVTTLALAWFSQRVPHVAAAAELDGAQLYKEHCAMCHGVDGRGDGPSARIFTAQPRDLREGFLNRYSTEDLVRRVRDGRSLLLALDLPMLRARATEVEAIVSHMQALPNTDWSLVDEGWGIYIGRCEVCHGEFGRPSPLLPEGVGPPRNFSDPAFQGSLNDEQLIAAVRHGRRGMPALTPRLSEWDARRVVAFVRLLSPGFEQYSLYCANCHGDDGYGVGSFAESISLPTVTFDRAYFQKRSPEHLRGAVWHMIDEHKPSMPHFRATISEAEARAIIDYLQQSDQSASASSGPSSDRNRAAPPTPPK